MGKWSDEERRLFWIFISFHVYDFSHKLHGIFLRYRAVRSRSAVCWPRERVWDGGGCCLIKDVYAGDLNSRAYGKYIVQRSDGRAIDRRNRRERKKGNARTGEPGDNFVHAFISIFFIFLRSRRGEKSNMDRFSPQCYDTPWKICVGHNGRIPK